MQRRLRLLGACSMVKCIAQRLKLRVVSRGRQTFDGVSIATHRLLQGFFGRILTEIRRTTLGHDAGHEQPTHVLENREQRRAYTLRSSTDPLETPNLNLDVLTQPLKLREGAADLRGTRARLELLDAAILSVQGIERPRSMGDRNLRQL